MSIRPSYRKRSVVQVLADGLSAHPPTGRSWHGEQEGQAMTINPKDARPGQVFKLLFEGRQCAGVRHDPRSLRPWTVVSLDRLGSRVVTDDEVSNLIRLTPAEVLENPEKSEKSCCEEAQLTANELARRNEELAEAEEESAAQKKRAKFEKVERERLSAVVDGLNEALGRQNVKAAEFRHRAEKAEAERDKAWKEAEVWRKLWAKVANRFIAGTNEQQIERERDAWRQSAKTANDEALTERDRAVRAEAERDELNRKLSDVIEVTGSQYSELQAKLNDARKQRDYYMTGLSKRYAHDKLNDAENRPTLDREAVKTILFRNFQNRPPNFDRAEKELSALAFETANAWPEWLGPKIDPDECDLDIHLIAPGYGVKELRERAHEFARKAGEAEAAARRREAMEAEQAATGDEEQRAKAFFLRMVGPGLVEGTWESLPAQYREWFTTTVPDDWTPPESEASE